MRQCWSMSSNPPTLGASQFSCPHCGALAHQDWWDAYARLHSTDSESVIAVFKTDAVEEASKNLRENKTFSPEKIDEIVEQWRRAAAGEVFINNTDASKWVKAVTNLKFSTCFSCKSTSVWIYDRIIYPATSTHAPPPNVDMPDDVRRDYLEAADIANRSPRGAAALLRLAIQRLMPHVGQKGKDLNSDIAELVKGGLGARVQKSLDVVRVIGNNSVHPGQMAIEDNPAVVATLFKLVNVIVDILISQPKHLSEAYSDLPENARKAIEKRDGG